MPRAFRPTAVVVIALALIAGACTSPTPKKHATGVTTTQNTSTVGITAGSVRISYLLIDLSLLTKQHLAPDLGDPTKAANAVVDEINANGGVAGGRKLDLRVHVIGTQPLPTADSLQRSCVQATEEDKAFAVIVAPAVPVNMAQCVSVTHQQLSITMDSWPQQLYTDAGGRVFSIGDHLSVAIEREYAFLPALFQQVHALTGKTIGILNQDQPNDRVAAAKALKSGLARAGIKLTAEATVPYPEGSLTCTQTDTAVQKMKDAKVDFVFLLAQNLCGAAIVKSAAAAGYKPQWATLGNNVTDTVAQFMAPAKANYDGAWGVAGELAEPSKAADDCNAIVARRAGLHYTRGSDSYGFAAVTCLQIQTLAKAIDAAAAPLTQGSVIAAFEHMSTVAMSSGPDGSLSASKHDAGDVVWLEKYSAAAGKFVPYDNTARRIG